MKLNFMKESQVQNVNVGGGGNQISSDHTFFSACKTSAVVLVFRYLNILAIITVTRSSKRLTVLPLSYR